MAIDAVRRENGNRTEPIFTLEKIIEVCVSTMFAVIWTMILVWYWRGGNTDPERYNLFAIKIVLPVTMFLVAFIIGILKKWNYFRFVYVIIFSLMYMLLGYLTVDLSQMLSTGIITLPRWKNLIPGAIVGTLGIVIGTLIRMLIQHTGKNRKADDEDADEEYEAYDE